LRRFTMAKRAPEGTDGQNDGLPPDRDE
jgi:hypothetical protein